MRKSIMLISAAVLAGCGQSSENQSAGKAAANGAAAKSPRPAYCFFKDSGTKGWAVKLDKSGNVILTGTAYLEDRRYKALLSPATVSGNGAQVAPTITQNDTGFGAPDNWWPVNETIPNSHAVETVTVTCGTETLATLTVPRKK